MRTFPFLWELSQFFGNLKEAFPLDKGYVFRNKWELSHFYRNFPIVMGTFRFLWELSYFYGNFPIFIGIFPFLWEFK
jgi:hypothetical protein